MKRSKPPRAPITEARKPILVDPALIRKFVDARRLHFGARVDFENDRLAPARTPYERSAIELSSDVSMAFVVAGHDDVRAAPKHSGIDEIRRMERNYRVCTESFLQRFSTEELILIHRAWIASGWDIPPDQWTDEQVTRSLFGTVPKWDQVGRPQ